MREIKFRIWDGNIGKMYSFQRQFFIDNNGRLFFNADPYGIDMSGKLRIYRHPKENHFRIMQYTGLKDENGKEMYEGDVVKMNAHIDGDFEYGLAPEIDLDFIGEVAIIASKGVCLKNARWEDNLVTSKHHRYGKCSSYKPIAAYRSSVIGNIYENRELLEAV